MEILVNINISAFQKIVRYRKNCEHVMEEVEIKQYLKGMDEYIQHLKILNVTNPDLAKINAINSLIISGVFNKDGTPKKNIVNRW